MTLQLGDLRAALLDAGASPELASKAAEELAGYEREFADIKSDLRLLKWQVTGIYAVLAVLIGIMGTTFWYVARIAAKVGALA